MFVFDIDTMCSIQIIWKASLSELNVKEMGLSVQNIPCDCLGKSYAWYIDSISASGLGVQIIHTINKPVDAL